MIGSNTINDVKFVDVMNYNFNLLSTSPVIGVGIDLSSITPELTVDINDVNRYPNPDVGAYEYVATCNAYNIFFNH